VASAELDRTVRPVFVLANQHRHSELNDLAGRLDSEAAAVELCEGLVPAPARSVSGSSPDGYRMTQAIGELPEDSGRSSNWCESTGSRWRRSPRCSAVTVTRRLSRGLRLVTEQLA
jgi:hypothetical protein